MRKVCLLCVALLIIVFGACDSDVSQDEYDEVQGLLEESNNSLNDAQNNIANLETELEQTSSDLATARQEISDLESIADEFKENAVDQELYDQVVGQYESSQNEVKSLNEEIELVRDQLGDDIDSHGCIGFAGYEWCQEKQRCIRGAEEECEPVTTIPNSDLTSGTEVGGIISSNTTWKLANSPYIVIAPILVSENVILTIEPGVTVLLTRIPSVGIKDPTIEVNGTLVAQGTENSRISFTTEDSWTMPPVIKLYGPDYVCKFALFDNITLQIYGWGNISVKNCIFRGTTIDVRTNAIISDNEIYGGSISFIGAAQFSENIVDGGGIRIDRSFVTITKNDIINCGTAIAILDAMPTLSNERAKITYNNIINNNCAIAFSMDPETMGPTLPAIPPTIEYNNIYGNTDFAVRIATSLELSCPNNWWGTGVSSEISQLMYDYKNDYHLSEIDYDPIQTSPISSAGRQ